MIFVSPDLWIVLDTMTGVREREMRVHWQCAPNVDVEAEHDTTLLISANSTRTLRMVAPGAEPFQVSQGWVSRGYGVRDAAPHLSCAVRGSGTVSLVTILCATPAAPIDVHRTSAKSGQRLDVRWGERRGLLCTGGCSAVGVDTDAAMAWIELDRSTRPVRVTAAGLSRLSIDGEPLPVQRDTEGIVFSRGRSGWETLSVVAAASVSDMSR